VNGRNQQARQNADELMIELPEPALAHARFATRDHDCFFVVGEPSLASS
jgi:hypothetical protein